MKEKIAVHSPLCSFNMYHVTQAVWHLRTTNMTVYGWPWQLKEPRTLLRLLFQPLDLQLPGSQKTGASS